VPEFSHGGYDAGIEGGVDGTWNPLKFSGVIMIDVPVSVFCELFESGHFVTKLRKGVIFFKNG